MQNKPLVICFDADDTLWVNEDYYRAAEEEFASLLADFGSAEQVKDALFKTEMQNLRRYGYGIKAFALSMIECAIEFSGAKLEIALIKRITEIAGEMLDKPVELLPGVKEVLKELHLKYKLIVATKGDLLDQERKLKASSVSGYFDHIEIMSDKTIETYKELLKHLTVGPEEFVMIGNSLRSDILPPHQLGCTAIYVPYAMTWHHEMDVETIPEGKRFHKVDHISGVLKYL